MGSFSNSDFKGLENGPACGSIYGPMNAETVGIMSQNEVPDRPWWYEFSKHTMGLKLIGWPNIILDVRERGGNASGGTYIGWRTGESGTELWVPTLLFYLFCEIISLKYPIFRLWSVSTHWLQHDSKRVSIDNPRYYFNDGSARFMWVIVLNFRLLSERWLSCITVDGSTI